MCVTVAQMSAICNATFCGVGRGKRVEYWSNITCKDARDVVPRVFDTVVCDTVLEDVVGAYFLLAVAGAYLVFAFLCVFFCILFFLQGLQFCHKHRHSELAVCRLAALGLRASINTGFPVY